ncbi:hypothetical protein D3C81_943910 [compost metagenome]
MVSQPLRRRPVTAAYSGDGRLQRLCHRQRYRPVATVWWFRALSPIRPSRHRRRRSRPDDPVRQPFPRLCPAASRGPGDLEQSAGCRCSLAPLACAAGYDCPGRAWLECGAGLRTLSPTAARTTTGGQSAGAGRPTHPALAGHAPDPATTVHYRPGRCRCRHRALPAAAASTAVWCLPAGLPAGAGSRGTQPCARRCRGVRSDPAGGLCRQARRCATGRRTATLSLDLCGVAAAAGLHSAARQRSPAPVVCPTGDQGCFRAGGTGAGGTGIFVRRGAAVFWRHPGNRRTPGTPGLSRTAPTDRRLALRRQPDWRAVPAAGPGPAAAPVGRLDPDHHPATGRRPALAAQRL